MVLEVVDKRTAQSTGCGARWAVDNCGKSLIGGTMRSARRDCDIPTGGPIRRDRKGRESMIPTLTLSQPPNGGA